LCIFSAIGAKMIRALADGTLHYEAACRRRARQREPREFDELARGLAERDGTGPLG
jgi:hypothetical protein